MTYRLSIVALFAAACCSLPVGGSVSSASLRLTWKSHSLAAGISVAAPADTITDSSGNTEVGVLVSSVRPILVSLRYGPGQDLARWRDGFTPDNSPNTTFSRETTVRICGQKARRIEAHTPERLPYHVMVEGGDTLQEHPAKDSIAVAWQHRGVPVVAFYVVETAQRKAYAADEAHFFASIRCD